MKVLFDHNVPKKLRSLLQGYEVVTARESGWDRLKNGDLLAAANSHGFDVMVTGDKNISYQQNLTGRCLSLIVLADTDWPTLKLNAEPVIAALRSARPGSYQQLQ